MFKLNVSCVKVQVYIFDSCLMFDSHTVMERATDSGDLTHHMGGKPPTKYPKTHWTVCVPKSLPVSQNLLLCFNWIQHPKVQGGIWKGIESK